jgi:hypothetical protein
VCGLRGDVGIENYRMLAISAAQIAARKNPRVFIELNAVARVFAGAGVAASEAVRTQ